MAKDLRTYIRDMDEAGELYRVNKEVDPETQMGALAEQSDKTILFTNVKGHPGWTNIMQVIRNWKQLRMILGTETDDGVVPELARRYSQSMSNPIKCERVSSGPVKEIIQKGDKVDITEIPAHIAQAGGSRFITLGISVMRDPVSGAQNLAIHRMQVKGKNKTGFFIRHPHAHCWRIFRAYEEMGQPTPVSIYVGHHPLAYLAGSWSPLLGVDEHDVASTVLGQPMSLVKSETNDLDVPGDSELVLEGEILPGVREHEGLFTEWTGTPRGGLGMNLVVNIKAVTRRHDAIYLTPQMTAGMNWAEMPVRITPLCLAGEVYRKLKEMYAGVVDIKDVFVVPNFSLAIIKMRPIAPGQAKNVLLGALSTSYLHIKMAVTVNEDIDIRSADDVWWAVSARVDPSKDIFTVPGCETHPMDGSQDIQGEPGTDKYTALGGKMGIDASVVINDPKALKLEKSRVPGAGQFNLKDFLS